jgi:hypothetical protein
LIKCGYCSHVQKIHLLYCTTHIHVWIIASFNPIPRPLHMSQQFFLLHYIWSRDIGARAVGQNFFLFFGKININGWIFGVKAKQNITKRFEATFGVYVLKSSFFLLLSKLAPSFLAPTHNNLFPYKAIIHNLSIMKFNCCIIIFNCQYSASRESNDQFLIILDLTKSSQSNFSD